MKKTFIIKQDKETITLQKGKLVKTINYLNPSDAINDYYVYFVFFNLELIYIGKGKGDRWKHTFKLNTHNPFVRKAIKQSGCCDYKNTALYKTYIIEHSLPEENAIWREERFIKEFTPFGNIDVNPVYFSKNGYKRLYDQIITRASMKNYGSLDVSKKTIIKRKKSISNKKYAENIKNEQEIHDLNLIQFFNNNL